MNSTQRGRSAEQRLGAALQRSGYQIIDYNWRTRRCEIDIIACKANTVFFIEVRYRQYDLDNQLALQSISKNKMSQIKYAALLWLARFHWIDSYRIIVAATNGTANYHFVDITD